MKYQIPYSKFVIHSAAELVCISAALTIARCCQAISVISPYIMHAIAIVVAIPAKIRHSMNNGEKQFWRQESLITLFPFLDISMDVKPVFTSHRFIHLLIARF